MTKREKSIMIDEQLERSVKQIRYSLGSFNDTNSQVKITDALMMAFRAMSVAGLLKINLEKESAVRKAIREAILMVTEK